MKIAHVQVIPKLSGAQQVSFDILNSINNDYTKFIICGDINEHTDFLEKFERSGIKVITIPSLKRNIGFHDILCFYVLYKIFKEYKFDIVHTNSTKPGVIARIAARFAGIKKIIHTVHGIAFHKHTNFLTRAFFFTLENISTLFGHENITVNKHYLKYYPLIKSKVIYNGVDFYNLHPNKNNIFDRNLNFAFFARLDEQKNPFEFIKAVKIVVDLGYNRDVKFTLAGDGELKTECEKLINALKLQDIIVMTGWIKDKDNFFNNVDVLCQPSKWEAFGLVFVEAAYYGIPSIATSVEGIPEVVLNNITGKLYESGNEIALADCIISYINNPSSISIMGDNAKDYVCKNFNKDNMIKKYLEIYQIQH